MKIEQGKSYQFDTEENIWTAVSRIRECDCWLMITVGALQRAGMGGEPPALSERWGVSDEYAERAGAREVDLANVEVDADGMARVVA